MSMLRRALSFVIVASLVAGCAVQSRTLDDSNTVDDSAAVWQDNDSQDIAVNETGDINVVEENLDPAVQESTEVLNSEQLSSTTADGIGLELQRGQTLTRFVVDAGRGEPSFDILTMDNPPRLAIDLLGEAGRSNRVYHVDNNAHLQRVRIGAHPDRTRIVLDLTDYASNTEKVNHKIDATPTGLVVSFHEAGTTLEEVAVVKDTPAAELPDAAGTQNEEEMPAPAQFNEEVAVEPQADSLDVAETGGNLVITALQLGKGENTPGQVIISLSDAAAFELNQTAPSEYVLYIPGASASEKTKIPQLASHGSSSIRTARAVEDASGAQVRLFVEAGTKLVAQPAGSNIVVKAVGVTTALSGARAQLAEGEAEVTEGALGDDPEASPLGEEIGVVSADGSKVYTGRLISLDLQDTDIDNALRIIAEVSNLNIIASDDVAGKVTLRLIDVPWDQALDVILKTNGLDQVLEGNVIRIAPVEKLRAEREALKEAKRAAEELEDLTVQYLRVSYARVTDIREQVESVLTERGAVATDERTNQLIIKDIQKGQNAVSELVARLDLRTPQVLLETQIVEATRSILRDLGFQWNYTYRAGPETGNATGYNFPNAVTVTGATGEPAGGMVNFPAALSEAGSAVGFLMDSADGTKTLTARLTALETEGRARIISRPQVATVNNKEAQIKSVETLRVRLPDSGTSVATGAGASAAGGGSTAFETIEVGIELIVTPQASPDYYVLLDVSTKSSTLGDNVVDNIPSTFDREANSTILVKSGITFALGGVYRIEDRDSSEGVPFFRDIPFIGHLFRRSLVDKGDEELIFFITPHIVEGSFDPSLM